MIISTNILIKAQMVNDGKEPDINSVWKKLKIFILVIGIIIIGGFFLLHWLGGKKLKKEQIKLQKSERFKILDVKTNVALVQKDSLFYIQKTNESTLRIIPFQKNKQINSLSLSNSGNYLSSVTYSPTSTSIDIFSLNGNPPNQNKIHNFLPDTTKLDSSAIKKVSYEISICRWSPISWSPNDSLIAFFVKNESNNHIFALAFNLSSHQVIWVETYEEKSQIRDLAWLNNEKLLITRIDEGRNMIELIN